MNRTLWALGHGGSLRLLLPVAVIGAFVFLPCLYIVDRHPRPWVLRTMLALSALTLLLALALAVYATTSMPWERDAVWGALIVFLLLLAAAFAFLRAAAHGADAQWLRPHGDPVAHWTRVLQTAPAWWLRSRAARELRALEADPRVPPVLEAATRSESNRHVLGALRQRGGAAAPWAAATSSGR